MRYFLILVGIVSFTTIHAQKFKLSNFVQNSTVSIDHYSRFKNAQDFFVKKEYSLAANEYRALVNSNPFDDALWQRLGNTFYELKQYPEAINAYKNAYKWGIKFKQWTAYNIAASYSLLNQKDSSIQWLKNCLYDQRFERISSIKQDNDFDNIKNLKQFKSLLHEIPHGKILPSRNERWKYDLLEFMKELKRINALYSSHPLPDNMQKSFEGLVKSVPGYTDNQIVVGIEKIIAMLGQSHNLVLDFLGAKKIKFTKLPVTLWAFPEGIFIIDAKDKFKEFIGCKLVKIGNINSEEVFNRVKTCRSSENEMDQIWSVPYMMTSIQRLNGLGILNDTSQVNLTLQPKGSAAITINVTPVHYEWNNELIAPKIPSGENVIIPLYLQHLDESFWYQPLSDSTLYFAFNSVSAGKTETLPQFGLRFREYLNANSFRNIIVDLRNNRGGDTYTYVELLRTLVAFSTLKDRKLYIIIGRATFSAAVNFAVDIERLTKAVFVGEPFSSKPNTHGDSSPFELPYSGLQLNLSSVFWQLSSPRDSRKWIMPQMPITLTAKDYFENSDPALNALQLLLK